MRRSVPTLAVVAIVVAACGDGVRSGFGGGSASNGDDGGVGRGGVGGGGGGSGGGNSFGDEGGAGEASPGDPTTCAEAAASKSYIGCDYWPTTVANVVWSIFDFAVVVANPQSMPAAITVTGYGGASQQTTVDPHGLTKIYLPWNAALKGPDWDACTQIPSFTSSVVAQGGAYHLVSSVPVTVYQFSALEYVPKGGPASKDWTACPGSSTCNDNGDPQQGSQLGCYSFSNDASLLLPSTAMTGNYRLAGVPSSSNQGSYFAITGLEQQTHVTVKLSRTASVAAGGAIASAGPGGSVTFALDAGDVAEIVGPGAGSTEDLSGSRLEADKPVQVIAGHPCLALPQSDPNATCDHVEASVFPAETLGKHYVVGAPMGPRGLPVGHVVRFYGNVDGTQLTYAPARPSGCPATIGAGAVVDCGAVTSDFEVQGDHEFSVATVQQSADVVDPGAQVSEGDPSLSFVAAVEQFRTSYIFLAPSDYDSNWADIVMAPGTTLTLDGTAVTTSPVPISPGFVVVRIPLSVGASKGAHVVAGDQPFGIQVLGYGQYTSYQYPGGLDLRAIAPPPAQ